MDSGMVRHTEVSRNIGFFRPERKGRLEVVNNEKGYGDVKHMARLWCKSAGRPPLPPLKLRTALYEAVCPAAKASERKGDGDG